MNSYNINIDGGFMPWQFIVHGDFFIDNIIDYAMLNNISEHEALVRATREDYLTRLN